MTKSKPAPKKAKAAMPRVVRSTAGTRAARAATRAVKYDVEPRVDEFIRSLPDWQQAICHKVRALVHASDDHVVETIKRTKLPFFVLEGNICALFAAKDHINVFLYDGGIVPDPESVITDGHDNKTARAIAFYEGDAINARALSAIFRHIIANNRAGGWRKLKAR